MTEETKLIMDELKKMDQKIDSVQLTIENELCRNIRLIAEGHLDLSRKLDQALQIENEKEMLKIKINTLENELRQLKERVDRIA